MYMLLSNQLCLSSKNNKQKTKTKQKKNNTDGGEEGVARGGIYPSNLTLILLLWYEFSAQYICWINKCLEKKLCSKGIFQASESKNEPSGDLQSQILVAAQEGRLKHVPVEARYTAVWSLPVPESNLYMLNIINAYKNTGFSLCREIPLWK